MSPALRRYLAAILVVYHEARAHDRAGAAYRAKRGLFTPDREPETPETIQLLLAYSRARQDLDKAHTRAEVLFRGLSCDDLRELYALQDEPANDATDAPGGVA